MAEKRRVGVVFLIPLGLKRRLKEISDLTGLSMSEIFRIAVLKEIDELEKMQR